MKTSDNTTKRTKLLKAAAVVMIAALVCTGIWAKYTQNVNFEGNVTFSQKLADDFKIGEHKAVRQNDGSYILSDEEVVQNTYEVMPGVDIPKDPFITLTNKSDVPAYLYIEIADAPSETVKYELTDEWQKINDCKGSNGGDVYAYRQVLDNESYTGPISVLKDDLVMISEKYDETTAGFNMKLYGYLLQKTDERSAEQIFKDTIGNGAT